jgi:hypothetical protein
MNTSDCQLISIRSLPLDCWVRGFLNTARKRIGEGAHGFFSVFNAGSFHNKILRAAVKSPQYVSKLSMWLVLIKQS